MASIFLDFSPPLDNPFVGKAGSLPEIYSLGHRNQQGLALHPETGQPFATEHGMQGGDELNAIEPGGNYGWPLVTYGRHYDGRRIVENVWRDDLKEPVVFWVPSIGPSGLAFYTGDRFPVWKGNIFAGALRSGTFHAPVISSASSSTRGARSCDVSRCSESSARGSVTSGRGLTVCSTY